VVEKAVETSQDREELAAERTIAVRPSTAPNGWPSCHGCSPVWGRRRTHASTAELLAVGDGKAASVAERKAASVAERKAASNG
jgi:hypothetical protein